MKNIKRNLQFIFGLMIVAGAIILTAFYARPQAAGSLKIYFLNVGQGDAEYIKTPSGQDILIDGGPDASVLSELGKVMDFGDHTIDLVILTHPHADHLAGLVEVLGRFQVNEVWESGVAYPSATYEAWKSEIKNKKVPDKMVKAGDVKNFANTKILILYPLSSLENLPDGRQVKQIDNLNNASVVTRLDDNKFSTLFMGDAEKDVQQKLLADDFTKNNLFATVLKVAHHGSANGTSEDFLRVVRPAVAVIEVGKDNTYGHPAPSTLTLLKKYQMQIYRTDQNGTIEISSDGEGYQVKTDK